MFYKKIKIIKLYPILIVAIFLGCQQEYPLFSHNQFDAVSWSGKYVEIKSSAGTKVCQGTINYLDDYISFVKQAISDSSNQKYTLYILDNPEVFSKACDYLTAQGCYSTTYNASFVYEDRLSSHKHEIFHNIHYKAMGPISPFFDEGLAVYFSSGYTGGSRSTLPLSYLIGLTSEVRLKVDEYHIASLFIKYMFDELGIEASVDFFKALLSNESYSEQATKFYNIFNVSMDNFIEEFNKTQYEFFNPPFFCWGKKIEPIDNKWDLSTNFSCDAHYVLSSMNNETAQLTYSTIIEVIDDSIFSILGDDAVTFEIISCDIPRKVVTPENESLFTLEAGTYMVHSFYNNKSTDSFFELLLKKVEE